MARAAILWKRHRLGRRIGPHVSPTNGSVALPKHTYRREKREKELNRQRKREEKQQRKLDRAADRAQNPDAAEPATPGAPATE